MRYFKGASGKIYVFYSYPIRHILPPVGGVYIFTRGNQGNPVYVGQTYNLGRRVYDHYQRSSCITQQHCNTIWVCREGNPTTRQIMEQDLCRGYEPICNERY